MRKIPLRTYFIGFMGLLLLVVTIVMAVRLAVNHDGDSDSTGSICGNIMGMLLGAGAIPVEWRDGVELCNVIRAYAVRLSTIPQE